MADMFKFKEKTLSDHYEGVRYYFEFPNGFGASVVINKFSYGGGNGLWELAVIKDKNICYSTELTRDVIGHLTIDEVNELLDKIQSLDEDGMIQEDKLVLN